MRITRPPGHVSLERALSKLGLASRAEARALIAEGRVTVGGRVVRNPGAPVVPERARILVDGRAPSRPGWILLALHKPRGVVTTRRDPQGRPTAYDLVAGVGAHVVPVGRLDLASTGLLLFTNDTQLAAWLTDPANTVVRRYAVTVRGTLADEGARRMQAGIAAGRGAPGERLSARSVVIRKRSTRETHLTIELVEGRNREIRRMLDTLGHEVTRLARVAYGGLELGSLAPGRWRHVPVEELRAAIPGAPVAGRDRPSGRMPASTL